MLTRASQKNDLPPTKETGNIPSVDGPKLASHYSILQHNPLHFKQRASQKQLSRHPWEETIKVAQEEPTPQADLQGDGCSD